MIGKYCVILMLLTAPAFAQQPEVLVELPRTRIFQGESARYTVILNNCDQSVELTLPQVDGLKFRQESRSTFSQQVFDGFKSVSIAGTRIEYVLTPSRTGAITIPGPTIVIEGKKYQGRERTLQVDPPSQQDLALLEVSASKSTVYPQQPFVLRLIVAVKSLPEPYTDQDPLRGAGDIPVLVIPWADDEALPEWVAPETPALRWLEPMLNSSRQQVGFGINNLRRSAGDILSLFREQQRALFRPEPRRVKRQDGQGRTVDYWEYALERTFTASRSGRLSFGPASLKGTFAARASAAGGVDVEHVYAIAPDVSVEVRDVPAAGRPASYFGAVGRFEVDAQLTPTSAKVGDPMQLTLRIRGTGSLQDAYPPDLQQVPAIAESFKIYDAKDDSADGERRFTYGLRPRSADIKEFPQIELAYFDVNQEKYVTLRTAPIPIEVQESDRLADEDIAIAAGARVGAAPAIEANSAGVFANISAMDRVHDERVEPGRWFLALGMMGGVFVVCAALVRRAQRRRENPRFERRRLAVKRAQEVIAESRKHAAADSPRQALELLGSALMGLVCDATGRDVTGLTSRDAAEALEEAGIPPGLARRMRQLLEELDAARYGAATQQSGAHVHRAEKLIEDLTPELRNRKLIV